ncbi:MAG: RHS repeat-associated core domain-containing protein [Myxococcota bacterium]
MWEYQYDHRNLRRSKLGSETADFIYDQQGRMLHEERAGISYDYAYLAGHLVAMFEDESASTTDYVVATDHLGAPQRVFYRTSGLIEWASDYDPFGRANVFKPGSVSAPTLVFNLRGSNQYFDAETGLHQNWYRYYDPNTGRYISEDPLVRQVPGFIQSAFSFVESNPLRHVDPDGRIFFPSDPASAATLADLASDPVLGPIIDELEASVVPIYVVDFDNLPEEELPAWVVETGNGTVCFPIGAPVEEQECAVVTDEDLNGLPDIIPEGFSAREVMAHELGHVYDVLSGGNPGDENVAMSFENAARSPNRSRTQFICFE